MEESEGGAVDGANLEAESVAEVDGVVATAIAAGLTEDTEGDVKDAAIVPRSMSRIKTPSRAWAAHRPLCGFSFLFLLLELQVCSAPLFCGEPLLVPGPVISNYSQNGRGVLADICTLEAVR